MLICPQCQSENPDSNRFCQECGTSLTQKNCFDCGTAVPLDVMECQNCGAEVGTVWWAILQNNSEETLPFREYLDLKKRYRVLQVLPIPIDVISETQMRVLDCYPFNLSRLETLFGQKSETQNLRAAGLDPSVTKLENEIPALAKPYLDLQGQYNPAIPAIYDAWIQDNQDVVLLEDRSRWTRLLNVWTDEASTLSQQLYWLHEMAQLWEALGTWRCRRSLLVPPNLLIDEDRILCVQRLYTEAEGNDLTLKELGQFWQKYFFQTGQSFPQEIADLLTSLQSGELSTIGVLQSRLQSIAYQFQEMETSDSAVEGAVSVQGSEHVGQDKLGQSVDPSDAETLDFSELTSSVVVPSQQDEPLVSQPMEEITEALNESSIKPSASLSTAAIDEADLEDEEDFEEDDGEEGYLEDDEDDEDDDERPGEGSEDNVPTVVLPMQLVSMADAGRTDVGRQRDHNEDCFGIQTEVRKIETPQGSVVQARGLFILCDGMGGHAGGEVASAMAVDTLRNYFQRIWLDEDIKSSKLPGEDSIREAIVYTNQVLFDLNQANARSGSGRMGTTLVLVLIQNTKAVIAHVGDSRLYRLTRRSGLDQLTRDHDVGQREILRGVEPAIAYARPDALQLTQALGPRDENFINPDIQVMELTEDTLLLLCSDGLADNDLVETHWQTHLQTLLSSQANLDRGVSELIDLANQYNGHDNITALLVRLKMRPNMDLLKVR